MCATGYHRNITLKEAEQRFLERNLSLIAERYNMICTGTSAASQVI